MHCRQLNIYVPDYVLFDLETTGVSSEYDEVIEIAAVKVRNGEIIDEFSTFVNPGMHIPFSASDVNNIYDDMVKDSPRFDVVLKEFIDFTGNDVLVGHNIHRFDMKFIIRDADRYYGLKVGNDYVDTLPLARHYLPELSHHRLVDLASYYGIPDEGAHRAMNDVKMNQQVFEMLGKEMQNPSDAAKNVKICPRCGSPLAKRSGKFGEFWGCTGYPDCRFTKNV